MRITLSIDEDVLEKAREAAGRLRVPFEAVVNEALRRGLAEMEEPATQRPYRTVPHDMGLQSGFGVNNVQELLAHAEGEECS